MRLAAFIVFLILIAYQIFTRSSDELPPSKPIVKGYIIKKPVPDGEIVPVETPQDLIAPAEVPSVIREEPVPQDVASGPIPEPGEDQKTGKLDAGSFKAMDLGSQAPGVGPSDSGSNLMPSNKSDKGS